MCLGKYHTFSNKLSLRFDKLVDQRIISGWLNKSPIRLFTDQRAGILLFLYIGSQIFTSGSGTRISEVIESKYRRKKTFPQNSVLMANFPAERSPDKRDITVYTCKHVSQTSGKKLQC